MVYGIEVAVLHELLLFCIDVTLGLGVASTFLRLSEYKYSGDLLREN